MQRSVWVLAAVLAAAYSPAYAEESSGFVILGADEIEEAHAVRDSCQGVHDRWFSVAAMFVGFREAIEAAVIVSVMINMLNKTGMPQMKRYVWFGVAGGIVLSCIIGAGLVAAYYVAQNSGMSTKDKAAFSGVFSGLAAFFLTAVGIQFLRFRDIETKYKKKLGTQLHEKVDVEHVQGAHQSTNAQVWSDRSLRSTAWQIMVLCFTAVLREGLETFLFLATVSASAPPEAIAIGGLTGVAAGLALGFCILLAGRAMKDMWWFLLSTTVFILFISAGLFSMSASAFKSVAVLTLGGIDKDYLISRPVYDIYKATGEGHQQCGFWAVLRAIVGYQHNPSLLWWLVYGAYWAAVAAILSWRYYKGTLFSKWGRSGEPPSDSETDSLEGAERGAGARAGGERSFDISSAAHSDLVIASREPPIPPTMPRQQPPLWMRPHQHGQGGSPYVFSQSGYPIHNGYPYPYGMTPPVMPTLNA